MKVLKLPDSIEPNKLLESKIRKENSICPFCGETKIYDLFTFVKEGIWDTSGVECVSDGIVGMERYGVEKPFWKHLFSKPQWWKTLEFKCHTCGAKWKTDEFPAIKY